MSLIKKELPSFLVSGEQARLIPVVADTSRENRATSVLLSSLSAVQEFSQAIFSSIGVRIGTRSNVEVYTEIVFGDKREKEKLRPDGLIVLDTGRSQWKALVETKVGNADLRPDQIKEYLLLAKKYNIDAVITISNQYSAIPSHHPINFKKSDLKGVSLFHFSWMYFLTEAILLLKTMGVEDADQRFLLNEMVRYLDHPSVGVSEFTSMNKEWKDVAGSVRNGAKLSKNSPDIEQSVLSWHQETRDLCLMMSRKLAVPVSLRLSRKHTQDPAARLRDDCEEFVKTLTLNCELDIPNAASPLKVTADLQRRAIDCSMTLNAPKDRQRPLARLNWLLRQLAQSVDPDILIRAYTPGRSVNPLMKLEDVRERPEILLSTGESQMQAMAFDVVLSRDLAGKFSGRTTFIQGVEDAVKDFYAHAGQHLKPWTPPAPKVKDKKFDDVHEIDDVETIDLTGVISQN